MPFTRGKGIPYTRGVETLRRYLKDNSITQAEFAAQLGVKQPTVSEWIKGDCSPTAERLKKIAELTGLSIDRLLDFKGGR